MSTFALASAHAGVAPRCKKRVSATDRRASIGRSRARANAVAVDAAVDSRTQADFDALWAWLKAEGVDVGKVTPALVDDAPGGRGWGLVAAEDIGGGDAVLYIPKSVWMTVDTALESPVGPHVTDEAGWIALALQLLHERAVGPKSKWAAYVAALPTTLEAPPLLDRGGSRSARGNPAAGHRRRVRLVRQKHVDPTQRFGIRR